MGRLPDLPCLTLSQFQGYARILFAIISFYFMPCCPSRPPPFTCSADFWTLWMDTLLESLIKVTVISSSQLHNPRPLFPAASGPRGGRVLRESRGSVIPVSVEGSLNDLVLEPKGLKLPAWKTSATGHGSGGARGFSE